jgi:hypothetical protein
MVQLCGTDPQGMAQQQRQYGEALQQPHVISV